MAELWTRNIDDVAREIEKVASGHGVTGAAQALLPEAMQHVRDSRLRRFQWGSCPGDDAESMDWFKSRYYESLRQADRLLSEMKIRETTA